MRITSDTDNIDEARLRQSIWSRAHSRLGNRDNTATDRDIIDANRQNRNRTGDDDRVDSDNVVAERAEDPVGRGATNSYNSLRDLLHQPCLRPNLIDEPNSQETQDAYNLSSDNDVDHEIVHENSESEDISDEDDIPELADDDADEVDDEDGDNDDSIGDGSDEDELDYELDSLINESNYNPDFESDFEEIDLCSPEDYLKHDPTPNTFYPRPDWFTLNELQRRRCGQPLLGRPQRAPTNSLAFERPASYSLWMIQRLKKNKTLNNHEGCVNCLDFNENGSLLCSGSDDLNVCVWDWQTNKLRKKLSTEHKHSVFHCEFCESGSSIITSARDGTVRLNNIETGLSRLLLAQSGEIGKLAFITPQTLVTCGTNACVNFIDLRMREPTKLFIVRNPKNNRTCQLHSISAHPLDKHRIVVGGSLPYVFLYDLRRVAREFNETEHKPIYCLDKFANTSNIVTSTAFNSTGDKLLISYNDDDLYMCRTDTCEIIHQYRGHRNRRTIKGCTWFGDKYVLSGSDDGHIYGWDVESEHIVCFLRGDDRIVNTLAVHPTLPVMASSGLESDVKIWEPNSQISWPQTMDKIKSHICKNTMRRKLRKKHGHSIPSFSDSDLDSDEVELDVQLDLNEGIFRIMRSRLDPLP